MLMSHLAKVDPSMLSVVSVSYSNWREARQGLVAALGTSRTASLLETSEDAHGEANMRAKVDGVEYSGHGLSTDIVAACAEALLEIINRAIRNADQVRQTNAA